MKWFLPSWNGDFRVESDKKNPKVCQIEMVKPTTQELHALTLIGQQLKKKDWVGDAQLWDASSKDETQRVTIAAPLEKVAPLMTRALKAGKQTLTAVRFSGGRIETVEGTGVDLDKLAKLAAAGAAAGEEADAGASVKRPTSCCPQCHEGAILPATEALLAFCDEEQHRQWAEDRTMLVFGGYTGNRYLVAHRHSAVGRYMGRVCADIDDGVVLHFHDMSVPPEEEVLAVKLCLEHRENWLRHEATMLTNIPYPLANNLRDHSQFGPTFRFKNPFGDYFDGVADSGFTRHFGASFLVACKAMEAPKAKKK